MDQRLCHIACLTLVLLVLVACTKSQLASSTIPTPTVRPTTEPSGKGRIERGEITSRALAGNLIGDPATREFLIYLPTSYDSSEKHYPVVFVLHGFGGIVWDMVGMVPILNEMVANAEAEEMILVFVDGSNRFGGSWYQSSPTIGDYESYIVRELVDHIDTYYRTLPTRDSRGITGCSDGGNGTLHLALKYPDVFSVAVPMSGTYDIKDLANNFDRDIQHWHMPEDFDDLRGPNKWLIAGAAAAASNPDKPPFYLDMPFEEVDGEVRIVPDVWAKMSSVFPVSDLNPYLEQPVRLKGLLLYHGALDGFSSVESARNLDGMLTELGVAHEYIEVPNGSHCNLDYAIVLEYMSAHLTID